MLRAIESGGFCCIVGIINSPALYVSPDADYFALIHWCSCQNDMHSDYQMPVKGIFPMKSSAQWDMNLYWLEYTRGNGSAPVRRAAIGINSNICTDAVPCHGFSFIIACLLSTAVCRAVLQHKSQAASTLHWQDIQMGWKSWWWRPFL